MEGKVAPVRRLMERPGKVPALMRVRHRRRNCRRHKLMPEVLWLRRKDASLFIATQTGGRGNGQRPNGTPGAAATRPPDVTPTPYSGPTQEIVTDSNTKLYKDVTQYNFQPGQNNNANNTGIQQKVEAVTSLDDLLGQDSTYGSLTVWGTKNGEQDYGECRRLSGAYDAPREWNQPVSA